MIEFGGFRQTLKDQGFKVSVRNRTGKVYLTVSKDDLSYEQMTRIIPAIVKSFGFDAGITSGGFGTATFRIQKSI